MLDVLKENSKTSGTFEIGSGRKVHGELTLSGRSTQLYLHDSDYIDGRALSGTSITGTLHDFTKVTLVNCICPGPGTSTRGKQTTFFAEVFPHFVVYGGTHLRPNEDETTGVSFVIDDATTLFYDFDAFGSVLHPEGFIEKIVASTRDKVQRDIPTGPHPAIVYFTGKTTIFEANTDIGRVSAEHQPTFPMGGPKGVNLKNTIWVHANFDSGVTFEESITRALTLLQFLELLVGRRQNILQLYIRTETQERAGLRVYWSMPPTREATGISGDDDPHPADVLLDATRQGDEFVKVLQDWISRSSAWRDARFRFGELFGRRTYTANRLIASANVFDILPRAALPGDIPLAPELEQAKAEAVRRFRALTGSAERDSILGALGRLGKSSLKHNIRHRAGLILEKIGDRFPDLLTVTDEAVNCRNHYVHGSPARFEYDRSQMIFFFTDTLQFIFGASDLVQAGWDIKRWSETGTTMSHPYGRFRTEYPEYLKQLKLLMGPSA